MQKVPGLLLIGTLIISLIAIAMPVTAEVPTGSGGITGRVTDQAGNGIAGANVKILDRYDQSHVYCSGSTNAQGNFLFTGVSNTWDAASGQYQAKYIAYVCENIGGQTCEGYSNYFAVEANNNAWVAIVLPVTLGATATPSPGPMVTVTPAPTVTAIPATGGISGRITTQDYTQGIPGASLKVVDKDDLSRVFFTGSSDSNGCFQFTGVQPTGSAVSYYKVYACFNIAGRNYEGYSNGFAVEPGSTAAVSVVVIVASSPTPISTPVPAQAATPVPTPVNTVLPGTPAGTGQVSGRVTINNSTGVGNATLKIVDTANRSIVYYTGKTGADGYYQLAGIDNTWDQTSRTYECRYALFASAYVGNQKFEGYSHSFAIEPSSTASVNADVSLVPANVTTGDPQDIGGNSSLQTIAPSASVPDPMSANATENGDASPTPTIHATPAGNNNGESGNDILQPIKALVSAIVDTIVNFFG